MYEAFFKLSDRPFRPAPASCLYYAARAVEEARKRLVCCVERSEGPGLLIGPAGTGKSLLCQLLDEQFRAALDVAHLTGGRLGTRKALLQAIVFELAMPYRGMDEGELRLSLIDRLVRSEPPSDGLLLIVDEAQTLPLRLLEELRLITTLAANGEPRVRLVLAGSAVLEERFASPKLEAFNQRIAARCYLDSLDRDETLGYVREQISACGGEASAIFTDEALQAAFRATDGVPRLINQVCDHALLLASAGGVRQLSAEGIEEAWADLQQLPTPWTDSSETSADGEGPGVIEFGSLDADDTPLAPSTSDAQPTVQFESPGDVIQSDRLPEPEVELDFCQAQNPFSESYVEEEVIVDQYVSLEEGTLAQRANVQSRTGAALSQLLAAAVAEKSRPNLTVAAAPVYSSSGEPHASQGDLMIVEDDLPGEDARPAGEGDRFRQLFVTLDGQQLPTGGSVPAVSDTT